VAGLRALSSLPKLHSIAVVLTLKNNLLGHLPENPWQSPVIVPRKPVPAWFAG